jgi:hypothetical protein
VRSAAVTEHEVSVRNGVSRRVACSVPEQVIHCLAASFPAKSGTTPVVGGNFRLGPQPTRDWACDETGALRVIESSKLYADGSAA